MALLSREVGEGLPKVREFYWELSLGRERGGSVQDKSCLRREASSREVYGQN